MTIVYKCDACGKTFDDQDDCLECEHRHKIAPHVSKIHLWDAEGKRLCFDYEYGNPDEVYAIKCDTEEACEIVMNWFVWHECVIPEDFNGNALVIPNHLVFWDSAGCGEWRSLEEVKKPGAVLRKSCLRKEVQYEDCNF